MAAYGKLHKDYSRHQNILKQPLSSFKDKSNEKLSI
jgi:hypothetical protein